MSKQNIAVVGSGISGLSAAWLLAQSHKVTLFESASELGGHAHTVDVDTDDGRIAVDTGFIVYNEQNYPNFTALLARLGVETAPTRMTFSVSKDDGQYEYSGSGFNGLFGQRRNLFNASHLRMIGDVSRFFRTARQRLSHYPPSISLGAFLERERYSHAFMDDHILPMAAAIWSTPMSQTAGFPARSFVEFFSNHGLMQVKRRPQWRTVVGGSRSYVEKLSAASGFEVCSGTQVRQVRRHGSHILVESAQGAVRPFDHVVLATHANQALDLLEAPTNQERSLLGCFRYQDNSVLLHHDRRWMPKRQRLWSSWNYLKGVQGSGNHLCMTYWMNALQPLPTRTNLFLTLNPPTQIHPKAVRGQFDYSHPVFDSATARAQQQLWSLQGENRTWFCGSYFGYGFHEDGVQSGLAVAEELGGAKRPWQVANESGRICIDGVPRREAAE